MGTGTQNRTIEGEGLQVQRNLTAAWTFVNSSSCTLSVELWRVSTHVAVVFGVTFQHTHTIGKTMRGVNRYHGWESHHLGWLYSKQFRPR